MYISVFSTILISIQYSLSQFHAVKEYQSLKAIDAIKGANELAPDIRKKIISNIVTDTDVRTSLLTFPEPAVG